MGKGFALRAGFTKAKGEIIATIDSDGSHRPEELPQLLTPILQNKADLVIGSRFFNETALSGKKFNAAGVRLFNFLIKTLTTASVSDSQSGYRVMKSAVLANLSLKSGEYEIESEMLVKIAHKGFRVKEVPISFEQRTCGKSRLDPIVDGFKILLSILTSYLRGLPEKMDAASLPKVSIIIAALNSEQTMGECLKSIFELNYPRESLEVILIDGCSTDDTVKIAEKYPVKIFTAPLNAPAAYNYALKIAGSEVLGLIDSDAKVEKEWLRKILTGYFS